MRIKHRYHRDALFQLQVASLAHHHPQVSNTPSLYQACLLTRTSSALYLITCDCVSRDRGARTHDEEESIAQHHMPGQPRLPEVAVLRRAPPQNDELETWLGIRKSTSTSTSGRSPKKMGEMSIAKLTSGVADGGWISR
jgi:hypothetical protein